MYMYLQVDLVTMLEKAISYVKFLQLQVKVRHQSIILFKHTIFFFLAKKHTIFYCLDSLEAYDILSGNLGIGNR